MINIIDYALINYIFIYFMIGLLHQIVVQIVRSFVSKRINQEMKDVVESSYGITILEIIIWPVYFIKRMIRYEEMHQTLRFVEDKLEAYYNEENNDANS